jgi:hypothetical protein
MKTILKLLTAACAIACLTPLTFAAESAAQASENARVISPAGVWKWTQQGRDGSTWEQSLRLNYAEGKLTGTLLAGEAPWGRTPEVPISDATFKDGIVAFSLRREFNGNSVAIKYEGQLAGDMINGTTERPNRDGGAALKREWKAQRVQ